MNQEKSFIDSLKIVISLLPLLGLIWYAALLSADLKQAQKDIEYLKSQNGIQIERLTAQVADLNVTVTRLETKMDMIIEGERK